MTLETTKSAVQRWHTMLQNSDMSMLSELLANDVVFRSPVAYQPYVGKQVVFFILTNVIQVFENFSYHHLRRHQTRRRTRRVLQRGRSWLRSYRPCRCG